MPALGRGLRISGGAIASYGGSNLVDYSLDQGLGLLLDFEARASDITDAGGGAVSAWVDLANGNNATQATAIRRPTFTASDAAFAGKPCITFGSSYLLTPSLTYGRSTLAMTIAGPAGFDGFWMHRQFNHDYLLNNFNATSWRANRAGGTGASGKSHPLGVNWSNSATGIVVIVEFDGTHTGHTMEIDGVSQALTTFGTASDNPGTATAAGIVAIGGSTGGTSLLPAGSKVSFMALYNQVLNSTQKAFLRTYAGGFR
jgi:hypothetical protein